MKAGNRNVIKKTVRKWEWEEKKEKTREEGLKR
jgi:hypothetical protein